MPKIPKQHQQFIKLVSEGINQTDAYQQITNGKPTNKTARENGSKLAKRYVLEIAQSREKTQKVIEGAKDNQTLKRALNELLTQAEVDAINCRIIKGERFEVQQLNAQGKVFKAEITPTIAERRAAIETYNKRFGSNEAIKTETKLEGSVETTIFYIPENGRKKQPD